MTSSPTLHRILALPVHDPRAPLPDRTAGLAGRLLPVQVAALAELERTGGGGFFEIGAGFGKTLVSFLAPYVLGARRTVLVVPPRLVPKTHRALADWRPVFPEIPDITVVATTTVSSKKGAEVLFDLVPDLLVADEAHSVMALTSARGMRLLDYVNAYPDCRVVYLSGTMGDKPFAQVASALDVTLRGGSPAPRADRGLVMRWAQVIDHKTVPSADDVRYLAPLAAWAKEPATQEGIRRAWRLRRTTAPGVLATSENALTTALEMTCWRSPVPPPEALTQAIKALTELWVLPDGTELVEALDFHRYAANLATGFWYRTTYTPAPHAPLGTRATWLERRATWSRELRRQILYIGTPGLDSPGRVVEALERGEGAPALRRAYADWLAVRHDLTVTREAVWLWPEFVDTVVDHLRTTRGVLWYSSTAWGDALAARGVPAHGRGTEPPAASVDNPACSIRVHGTGQDLQAWDRGFVVEPPRGKEAWEQLLARHHRHGQRSDTVVYEVNTTLWPSRVALQAAIQGAKFSEQVAKQPQRILYATWR